MPRSNVKLLRAHLLSAREELDFALGHVPEAPRISQDARKADTGKPPDMHIVVPGDTLTGIGKRHDISVSWLLKKNPGVTHPDRLWVGQEIRLGFDPEVEDLIQTVSELSHNEIMALPGWGSPINPIWSDFLAEDWVITSHHASSYTSPPSPKKFLGQHHVGVDLNRYDNQDEGLPIYAMHAGVITYNRRAPGTWGGLINIDHENGMTSRYGHATWRTLAKEGDRVKRGEMIASIGGRDQGMDPHAHIEIVSTPFLHEKGPTHWSGKDYDDITVFYVDPLEWVNVHGWWRNLEDAL